MVCFDGCGCNRNVYGDLSSFNSLNKQNRFHRNVERVVSTARGMEFVESCLLCGNMSVADLCSNYYLASRLPYAMYANRSC